MTELHRNELGLCKLTNGLRLDQRMSRVARLFRPTFDPRSVESLSICKDCEGEREGLLTTMPFCKENPFFRLVATVS